LQLQTFQSQYRKQQIIRRANMFVLCALPIATVFVLMDNRETVKARSSSVHPTVTQRAAIPSTKAPIQPRIPEAT
jgi:hypothetical protein